MNRYSNTAFIPYTPAEPQTSDHMFNVGGAMQDTLSGSTTLSPETHQPTAWEIKRSNQLRNDYFNGLYNWANAHRDPSCAAEAKRIFGDNLCPADKEEAALYLGQSLLDATGHTQDPAGYYRAIGKELPTGYADYATLLRRIGQDFIKDQQSLYDQNKKALAEAQAANKEQQARKDKCISIEKEAPARDPKQPREEMMVYIGLALVGLLVAGWVLYAVAVVLLTMKDWLVQRVGGTCGAMRAGVPVIWQRMSSPEGMRGAFLVLVAALVVIALCLVVIAFVLLF